MSAYPVLNDRPIDQWKVMELKDELCKRNLPTEGLKDDLVKRLFQDLQGDILGGEGTVGTLPDDDLKEDKAPKSADASAYQASVEPLMEQIVDEGSSEVGTHEGDLGVSVTEASKTSTVVTPDVISQEAVVAAAEVNNAPLADGAITDEIIVTAAVAIEGDDLESVLSDGTTVKEVRPQAEGHSKIIVKKAPEEDTSKKMIIDDLQFDVVSSDLKLSASSAKGEIGAETREQEAVLSPPDAIISRADTDHGDADVVSTAPEQNSETMIPEINFGANDSIGGGSPEKVNLGRSSGDAMMEDVMESKHVNSNIKSDDLEGKTEFTSEHVVKEVIPSDTAAINPSVGIKETVAEGNPATPTKKRKPGAQEVLANEPIKCQRRWNSVSVKSLEQQASKLSVSDAPNNVSRPALKHCFVRSDSTSGGPPKDRIVPASQKPITNSLRVDLFLRPFTLKAVQEFLSQTGSICNFWMDHIKTHCYVTYSSVEEAVATRNAVYNLQWPPHHGNYLVAEFVDPHEVKLKLEAPDPSPDLISLGTATIPKAVPFQQSMAKPILSLGAGTSKGLLPTPQPFQQFILSLGAGTSKGPLPTPQPLAMSPPSSGSELEGEMLPSPPESPNTSQMALDDLFKRTHASPRIYYLPLSEEEVSAKLASRNKRKSGG